MTALCAYHGHEVRKNMEHCSCGFYSYKRAVSPPIHAATAPVSGVIQVSGRTVVGTKGYRSEKAEIKALYVNKACYNTGRIFLNAFRAMWRRNPPVTVMMFGFYPLWLLFMLGMGHGLLIGLCVYLGVMMGIWAFTSLILYMAARDSSEFSRKQRKVAVERMRGRYPTIPVYTSWRQLLKDFPVQPVSKSTKERS